MQAEIRFATEEDAARMLEIYTPYVLETPITFEITPPGVEEFRARVREKGMPMPPGSTGGRPLGGMPSSQSMWTALPPTGALAGRYIPR